MLWLPSGKMCHLLSSFMVTFLSFILKRQHTHCLGPIISYIEQMYNSFSQELITLIHSVFEFCQSGKGKA